MVERLFVKRLFTDEQLMEGQSSKFTEFYIKREKYNIFTD